MLNPNYNFHSFEIIIGIFYLNTNYINNLNSGLFTNVLLSAYSPPNGLLFNNSTGDKFLTVSMDKNSNRKFIVNFPISIKLRMKSSIAFRTNNLKITNLTIRVFKSFTFKENIIATPINTPYGTTRDFNKPQTSTNTRVTGEQYYGNFYIHYTPDFIDRDNDNDFSYNFYAIPTFSYSLSDTFNTDFELLGVINSQYSTTFTEIGPVEYLNTTTSGYTSLEIRNQVPVSTSDAYLGCGLIDYFPLLEIIMPVGYIYISTNKTNPRLALGGFGTWEAINDKFLRGIDTNNLGETVGATGSIASAGTSGLGFYNVVIYRRTS